MKTYLTILCIAYNDFLYTVLKFLFFSVGEGKKWYIIKGMMNHF